MVRLHALIFFKADLVIMSIKQSNIPGARFPFIPHL